MIEPDMMTPNGYAKLLAKYIKDPSTIRARTIDEYGKSPSIDDIRRMQQQLAYSSKVEVEDHMDCPHYFVPVNKEYLEVSKVEDEPPAIAPISNPTSPMEIIRDIAAIFNLTYGDITGHRRHKYIVQVRHLVAALLVARGNSRGQVGKWLGGRDHTTIVNSLDRFNGVRESNPQIDRVYREHLTAWNISTPD